jgi:alkylation response protein AidB-like acyl-CoA dehydrogenase
MNRHPISSPDDPALAELCRALGDRGAELDRTGAWPAEQLRLCGEYGVYRWFAAEDWGGLAWDHESIIRGYLALAEACLTTTFVLTQREGACRRIETSANESLKQRLLPGLTSGELFATVGISHLTTSRRHVARPVLRAYQAAGGFTLDGFSPWVTGAKHADYVVVGATVMHDEQPADEQLLVAIPTEHYGARAAEPERLVGLSASESGRFHVDHVLVERDWLVAGPAPNVMSQGIGAGTGGLQTSTLALGLARSALRYLNKEADRRADLRAPFEALEDDYRCQELALFAAVRGEPACSNDELRGQANSLVLRCTQAALAAAKGSGYVAGHPAGRWCREALFFLVWSCPQPVVAAQLCELAGILE